MTIGLSAIHMKTALVRGNHIAKIFYGEKTGLAYSDKIELAELLTAAKNVRAIARQGQNAKVAMTPKTGVIKQLYAPLNPLRSLSDQEKVDFLRKIDVETRKIDPRIEQVIISLVGVQEHILIANQGSSLLGDVRPLVRMNVSVIVADKGQREQGSIGEQSREHFLQPLIARLIQFYRYRLIRFFRPIRHAHQLLAQYCD
jgi:TldD protein